MARAKMLLSPETDHCIKGLTNNKEMNCKSNNCKTTTTRDWNIFILPLKDFQAVPFLVFPVKVMRGSFYVSFNLMLVECNS